MNFVPDCFFCALLWAFVVLVILALICNAINWNPCGIKDVSSKHVMITGGSSGIGKSVGVEMAKRGANVTIIARNLSRLEAAVEEISKHTIHPDQQINYLQIDVMNTDYSELKNKFDSMQSTVGPAFMLFNCAGSAICGVLEDLTPQEIQDQLSLNTTGSIFATKAVLEGMKERKEGHIVFTASQGAYIGLYGMSVYCATKFALKGFAEGLHMEVDPYGITVTVAFPPDTDTPGFEEEEKRKPKETKLITQGAGLFNPDHVAVAMINDALSGRFSSNVGLDGFMLENLCCGMSPANSWSSLVIQTVFLGVLRVIGSCYTYSFSKTIKSSLEQEGKLLSDIEKES